MGTVKVSRTGEDGGDTGPVNRVEFDGNMSTMYMDHLYEQENKLCFERETTKLKRVCQESTKDIQNWKFQFWFVT